MIRTVVLLLLVSFTACYSFPWGDTATVDIIAVGDIFPSPSIIEGGITTNSNRDYTPYFAYVKPILSKADLVTAWFGGPVEGTNKVYTGYPAYNNPPELPLAVKDAGIDYLFHTNHLFDQGIKGLINTVAFFRKIGLKMIGMYSSEEESREIVIFEKNNIKIAYLTYLYSSNVPMKHPKWMVNYIEPKKIGEDIRAARAKGADFVIVAPHWGTEYRHYPDAYQLTNARIIASLGADMILGSHPHQLEPTDMLFTTNTNGTVRKTFVIYCLGNFFHTMQLRYTDSGMMMKYRIEKNLRTGETVLKNMSYIPVWLFWRKNPANGKYTIRVIPTKQTMDNYTNGKKDIYTKEDFEKMKQSWNDTIALMDNPKIGFVHEE